MGEVKQVTGWIARIEENAANVWFDLNGLDR